MALGVRSQVPCSTGSCICATLSRPADCWRRDHCHSRHSVRRVAVVEQPPGAAGAAAGGCRRRCCRRRRLGELIPGRRTEREKPSTTHNFIMQPMQPLNTMHHSYMRDTNSIFFQLFSGFIRTNKLPPLSITLHLVTVEVVPAPLSTQCLNTQCRCVQKCGC